MLSLYIIHLGVDKKTAKQKMLSNLGLVGTNINYL